MKQTTTVPDTTLRAIGTSPAAGGSADPLASYFYAIKSKATKRQYIFKLRNYFNFLKIPGNDLVSQANIFLSQAQIDHRWAYDCLVKFITHLKKQVEDKQIAGGTLKNYYAAIKLFYEQNDIELSWNKIKRGLPDVSSVANDRSPTVDELRKLIQAPDMRVKVIVLTMISSGIRLGAWDNLKVKHLTPISDPKSGQVVAAKLKVYDGETNPYHTYVTPEAHQAIEEYLAFRRSYGEQIGPESWILRDKFPTTSNDMKHAARKSLATNPVKLEVKGVSKVLRTAFYVQGLRDLLPKGERRHEFKLSHGFRKYFKSNAERVMRPLNVELLMDHQTGISDSYWKPTEHDLQEDYCRAVDYLIVNKESKVISEMQNNIMQKLVQRENEIESMKRQFEELKKTQDEMVKTTVNMQRLEDWINEYSDEKLPMNIEMMIGEFLDPYEDGTVSKQERIKRQREFPELVKAAKKLQKMRQLATTSQNNNMNKKKNSDEALLAAFRAINALKE